jgi:hypothetical protein
MAQIGRRRHRATRALSEGSQSGDHRRVLAAVVRCNFFFTGALRSPASVKPSLARFMLTESPESTNRSDFRLQQQDHRDCVTSYQPAS